MSWETIRIGDLGRVVTGKTPPTKERQFYGGDYPFITPSDLDYDSYRVRGTSNTLSNEARSKFQNQFLPENAITFTCIASVGKIGVTTTDSLTNQQINSIIVNQQHDWRYVYYLLRNEVRRIQGMCSGVATPIINKKDFEKVKIRIPSELAIEQRVASILSAYDDLIENNRRRIRLLEQAARLLYKEWFVHLRFPGHEHTTITNGIPEGWRRVRIADIGEVITGKTPSKKNDSYYGNDVPFIKTPDMHGKSIVVQSDENLSKEGAYSQPKKTLPPRSILVSCIGTVGAVALNGPTAQTNQQINAIVPKDESLRYLIFFIAQELKPLLEGMGGGSTMANVNRSKFSNITVVVPSPRVSKQFSLLATSYFDQIEKLSMINIYLIQARDLLLPRLMNGKVTA